MINPMKKISKLNDESEELNLSYFDVTNALVAKSQKIRLKAKFGENKGQD